MHPSTQSELVARVERVRNDAVLLLEALYQCYPELRILAGEGELSPSSSFALVSTRNPPVKDPRDHLKYDPNQPRDRDGRWSSGGFHAPDDGGANIGGASHTSYPALTNAEAHLLNLLNANSHLSVQNRRDYAQTFSKVLARMPPSAHAALLGTVKEIKAFNTIQELRLYEETRTGEDNSTTWGIWNFKLGHLILDGGSEGIFDEKHENRHRIREGLYAHEMTHAIDWGHQPRISQSLEWQQAYQEEIKKESKPLSNRANHSAVEGFAELGRLLYSGKNTPNREYYQKNFPKCYAIFEQNGLIMENQEIKNQDMQNQPAEGLEEETFDEKLARLSKEYGRPEHMLLEIFDSGSETEDALSDGWSGGDRLAWLKDLEKPSSPTNSESDASEGTVTKND